MEKDCDIDAEHISNALDFYEVFYWGAQILKIHVF